MCVIERFNLIHPNGAPERKDYLFHCEFGSPVAPCNNTRIQPLPDRFVPIPEPAADGPRYAAPVEARSPRRRQEETRRLKKFSNDLKLVWDFHIPFTSRKPVKKKRSTSEHGFVRRHESQRLPEVQHPIQVDPPIVQPMHRPPADRPAFVQLPHRPLQQNMHPPQPQVIRPRRHHPLNVQIHHAGDSSSPSPPTRLREHHRHQPRTAQEVQRYEELKRQVREREGHDHAERQRRELAERTAREAVEARRRMESEMESIRRQNEELRRAERRRDREERERQQHEEEELRFQERERRRREREERHQRRMRLDELRRNELVQAEIRREEQEAIERERARIRQEDDDRQLLQEEMVRDRLRRDRNERDRIERRRRAGIPHWPRHETEVHHRPRGTLDERGDQVIDDAIRAENRRRFDNTPGRGWTRRRDIGGGLRRRDTIAVTQRRIYEDDWTRRGARFV